MKFREDLFELVAIGTVADLSSAYGMKIDILLKRALDRCVCQSVLQSRRLHAIAGTEQATVSEESIGFMIGPRLNAAGRLGDATPAVRTIEDRRRNSLR